MRGAEWSLILFTLLTQLAVGMFVVLGTANAVYISKSNNFIVKEIAAKILPAVIVVLILAIAVSFLHIGRPKIAAYAASHFSKSWLSREIVFLMLFTLLAGLSLVVQRISAGSNLILTVITGVIGIITIISMAKVYMLATVPVWNHPSTPIQFISTSFVLGGLGAVVLFILPGERSYAESPIRDMLRILFPVLLLLISLNLLASIIHLHALPGTGIAGTASFKLLTEKHIALLVLRMSMMLVSIILFCALLFTYTKSFSPYLFYILCSVVLISEIIGRYLFYASYSRVGI
jgi:anaerobic dimethyl sulfoxide reductase subunit C (anchor subunit)